MHSSDLIFGGIDLLLGLLFVMAYLKTPAANRPEPRRGSVPPARWSATLRSIANFPDAVELRSNGQMRTSAPTWFGENQRPEAEHPL